ncbi:MAG: hypothetical protein ACYC3X_22645 [Pirellulaceae bacterium]
MLPAKSRALFVTATSLCLVLFLLTGLRWHTQLTAARFAVSELAACQAIAAEIESLRAAPKSASLQKQTDQQITLSIQRAAQVAEIPDSDILRITPQQGRRLGKSAHVQQPTAVEIRQATLGQLSRFLGELSLVDVGLQPTSMRLAAPRTSPPAAQTELWACELVLTYLVFSPE